MSRPLLDLLNELPAVEFVRHARAKRYLLRLLPNGIARVTIPRGGSRAEAERFVARSADWLGRQQRRLAIRPGPEAWRAGERVWWRGVREIIELQPGADGTVVQVGDVCARTDASVLDLPRDLRPLLSAQMRLIARADLPMRVVHLAAAARVSVKRVVVRNQRTRWGSCASSGTISLNWRLVQMPDLVRDYVIYHELAHVTVPNHSLRFWRVVEAMCPDYADARAWLRREGRAL